MAGLSPDATLTLVAGLSSLSARDQCQLARALKRHEPATDSWRSWNYGRASAREVLQDKQAELEWKCD